MYVLRSLWDTVRAFLAAQTQWRPDLTGLDYAGARVAIAGIAADGHGLAPANQPLRWREVFPGLQEIEGEVLKVWSRQRDEAMQKAKAKHA
ncbi:MAG: hypothetical protein F4X59_17420 [Holophagales bacterium]|nr:hypothetical protein [Holophagales bacterium]MYC11886.1 hypothetical protein [Holophagales bacterium]